MLEQLSRPSQKHMDEFLRQSVKDSFEIHKGRTLQDVERRISSLIAETGRDEDEVLERNLRMVVQRRMEEQELDKRRAELLGQAQRLVADDAVAIYLYEPSFITIAKAGLRGLWKDAPILAVGDPRLEKCLEFENV